jgi:hypothetical protein
MRRVECQYKKGFFQGQVYGEHPRSERRNTMKFQWYVNNTGLHTNGSWQNFNRAMVVTLTYRFGKDMKTLERKDLEENTRLGGGGGKGK